MTVAVNWQVSLLPEASVAVNVTVIVSLQLTIVPLTISDTTVTGAGTLSVTVGISQVILAYELLKAVGTVRLFGHVSSGGTLSKISKC